MSVRLDDIARDVKAEREGEWRDSHLFRGVSYKVRSLNNPDYRRAKGDFNRRRDHRFQGATPDPEWVDREFGKLVADHLLAGWDGIDPAYTPEVARKVLTDPRFRDIADDILALAGRVGEPARGYDADSSEGTPNDA